MKCLRQIDEAVPEMSDSKIASLETRLPAAQPGPPASWLKRVLYLARGQPDHEVAFMQSRGRPSLSEISNDLILKDDDQKDLETPVFQELHARDCYAPIDSYEGRHRYDPTAQWTEAEERVLVRKVSLYQKAFWPAKLT